MKKITSESDLIESITGLLHREDSYKLVFEGHRRVLKICVSNKAILYATSDRLQDKLSEILFKAGKLTQEQYLLATELSIVTKKKIGDILVREGFLAVHEVVHGLTVQAKKIIRSLFEYPECHLSVVEREPTDAIDMVPQLSIIEGLLEGVRSVDSLSVLHDAIPLKNAILQICPDREAFKKRVEFTRDEMQLLSLIDGTRNFDEVFKASRMFEYRFYKTLYPLLVLKVVAPLYAVDESASVDDVLSPDSPPATESNREGAVPSSKSDKRPTIDHASAFEEAKMLMSAEKYSVAAHKLKALIAADDKKSIYYYYLGLALDHVPGQNKEAEKVFKIAIRLQNYNVRYYLALGYLYLRRNMKAQARKQFMIALQWDPNDRYVKEAIETLKKHEKKPFDFLTTKLF
ncbi:MAG: hypothetical protein R3231_03915 [bacterium]|nr:hypothetical protein [bacterium]